MEPNERTEQRRVVVHNPGQRSEIVTERTQIGPRESGLSTGTIAVIAILAVMAVITILYLVSDRNANESANRNANMDVASQANREQPPVIIQQPAPPQQAPVIIQQPAPPQQAPVIIEQPAQPSQRDSASDDANMQEVATKRLSEELNMEAVSVTISEARAVLTGTANSEAIRARAERLVKAVRGVKSVDNKIVVSG